MDKNIFLLESGDFEKIRFMDKLPKNSVKGKTPLRRCEVDITGRETDAKNSTHGKEAKPEDIQDIVLQQYREHSPQFYSNETQEIIARRIRAGQRRFPRNFWPVILTTGFSVLIILVIWENEISKERESVRQASDRVIKEQKAAEEKAAMDAKIQAELKNTIPHIRKWNRPQTTAPPLSLQCQVQTKIQGFIRRQVTLQKYMESVTGMPCD